jgi:sulfopyruvate decarboxylase subunit alpha
MRERFIGSPCGVSRHFANEPLDPFPGLIQAIWRGRQPMNVSRKIVDALVEHKVEFVTTVPCKQLAGVIDLIDKTPTIRHVPANKEDEGMGLCAGAYMGGKRAAIIMQNTAIGATVNALATLIQYYQIPLPMLISYRGELGERIACQVEMAVHTRALLNQLNIQTWHFHKPEDADEIGSILKHTFMSRKPTAILTDSNFWGGY